MAAEAAPPLLWQAPKNGLDGTQAGQVGNPRGIAADPSTGSVYVAELANNRISEFTPWGQFVKAWGWNVAPDASPGDTPEDELEVCTVVCQAGVEGGNPGQFAKPTGIAVDPDGDVYVYELSNRRIQKFAPDGSFQWMVGGSGVGPGQFSTGDVGNYVAVGPDGHLYVGDVGRIQEFDADGNFVDQIGIGAETVGGLAIDDGGSFLVLFSGKDNVRRLNAAGAEFAPALPVEGPHGVAVDSEGFVYALEDPPGGGPAGRPRIVQFNPAGTKLIPSAEELDTDEFFGKASQFGLLTGIATSSACNLEPDDLYSSRFNSAIDESNLRAYGPPPDSSVPGCEPPPAAPEITAQFATTVNPDGAIVKANVNPEFWADATFFVEYGTGKCSEGGCLLKQPTSGETALESGTVNVPFMSKGTFLPNLEPATTYRFRFVAKSGGGGPTVGSAGGGEGTFTTPAIPAPAPNPDPCPNVAFRTGLSAFLPDCRAYEMVSPVDKDNGDIFTLYTSTNSRAALDQAAAAGSKLTYSTYRAFGDAEGAPYTSQYIATRVPGSGWSSGSISPPRGISILGNGSFETEYRAFSEDLCLGWILHDTNPILAPGAVEDFANFYRVDHCGEGGYDSLTTKEPATLEPKEYNPELQGVSADGAVMAFRVADKLTTNAASEGKQQCYEADGINLRLVSVLPSGQVSKANCSIGTANSGLNVRRASVDNAVSDTGTHIIWTASTNDSGPGEVFLRLEHKNPTIAVSAGGEALSGQTNASQFLTAASDGSKAIYSVGDPEDGSAELYEFDSASKATNQIVGQFRGLLGASEDASRIYLVSEASHDGAPAGQPNLYLYEAGVFTFVATLAEADAAAGNIGAAPSAANLEPYRHLARVSADGLYAAFMSTAPLTGYDNTDAASGQPDGEVFRYDAAAEEVLCVSCNPTGARPSGRELTVQLSKTGIWAAAQIPGATTQTYSSRVLSEDGSRLYFESYEALVPRDTNTMQDVYQWEVPGAGGCDESSPSYSAPNGGCLALISSGKDPADARFVDASADGADVFFATGLSLVIGDPGLIDIYDARVEGGFAPPPSPNPPCQGEACQSSAPAPPVPTPSSSTYSGPGNVKSGPPRRCPKGRQKVKRKGKVRCVKNAGRKGAQRSASAKRGSLR